MTDCPFCAIVAGTLPASIVHQDEVCTAFLDIRPVNPGHTLVIPNAHAAHLADVPPEAGGPLFRTAQRIAAALRTSGVRCEGINFWLADGEAAGQEVMHVHLHVVPRFRGDGFGIKPGPTYGHSPSREELDVLAERIRAGLG